MPYVSEKIVKKEDKEYFNSFHFLDVTKRPLRPYWWAIDREKEYIIFPMGGGAFEIPEGMGLYMDNAVIEMWVKDKEEGNRQNVGLKVEWSIYRIKVPKILLEKGHKSEEIINEIKRAFYGLGTSGVKRENITEVTVEINADIEIV